jgi:hypothetical protein
VSDIVSKHLLIHITALMSEREVASAIDTPAILGDASYTVLQDSQACAFLACTTHPQSTYSLIVIAEGGGVTVVHKDHPVSVDCDISSIFKRNVSD